MVGAGTFHYQIDIAATILELLGQRAPSRWDGQGFASSLRAGDDHGRDHLVVSQAAWACQRGVRFEHWIYINTRHGAYHLYPDEMLFDLAADPHEQHDVAGTQPVVLSRARSLLADWLAQQLPDAARGRDPHDNVMAEGGPYHVRGKLPAYAARLRATERSVLADLLEHRSQPVGRT